MHEDSDQFHKYYKTKHVDNNKKKVTNAKGFSIVVLILIIVNFIALVFKKCYVT